MSISTRINGTLYTFSSIAAFAAALTGILPRKLIKE